MKPLHTSTITLRSARVGIIAGLAIMISVSYTHLDVYKRQRNGCLRKVRPNLFHPLAIDDYIIAPHA